MTNGDHTHGKVTQAAESVTSHPLFRLATPATMVAIAAFVFSAGQTLDSIDRQAQTNCTNTEQVVRELHQEHQKANGQLGRFGDLFPPPVPCP